MLCSLAAVLSTLLCGSLAVRWLFDEGAELKQSRETEEEERPASILQSQTEHLQNTSTLNSLSHQ